MSKIIDYYTNLDTTGDKERMKFTLKMSKQFGYVPVYGPTMNDLRFAMQMFSYIIMDYPGYKWVVEYRDSILSVVNESLAPDWGFRLRHKMIDNDGKVIRKFAGMLLERYGLSRGAVVEEELAEKPRDLRGNVARV